MPEARVAEADLGLGEEIIGGGPPNSCFSRTEMRVVPGIVRVSAAGDGGGEAGGSGGGATGPSTGSFTGGASGGRWASTGGGGVTTPTTAGGGAGGGLTGVGGPAVGANGSASAGAGGCWIPRQGCRRRHRRNRRRSPRPQMRKSLISSLRLRCSPGYVGYVLRRKSAYVLASAYSLQKRFTAAVPMSYGADRGSS